MAVITNVVLPVVFVVLLGYLLRRLGGLDEHAFSRAQIYILSPALVFTALAGSDAAMPLILKVLLQVLLMSTLLLGVVQGIGFASKSGRNERNAMSLAAVFTNSGFYGIPVCMLAFGEMGVIYASIYVACSATFQATIGIYIASSGTRKAREALASVFKVPIIYAIILGKLLSHFRMLPPEPFMKMIDLMGKSAIPLGLLLLGMQLERIVSESSAAHLAGGEARRDLLGGTASGVLRIAGGFILGLLVVQLFDFDPVLKKVIIVESAMPTAVNAVVYATEFGCRPKLVTIGILTSTLISVVSISVILNWLG